MGVAFAFFLLVGAVSGLGSEAAVVDFDVLDPEFFVGSGRTATWAGGEDSLTLHSGETVMLLLTMFNT